MTITLTNVVQAEAPSDVVAQMAKEEINNKSSTVDGLPSPATSEQQSKQSVAQQRQMLEMLQTLISKKLSGLSDQ